MLHHTLTSGKETEELILAAAEGSVLHQRADFDERRNLCLCTYKSLQLLNIEIFLFISVYSSNVVLVTVMHCNHFKGTVCNFLEPFASRKENCGGNENVDKSSFFSSADQTECVEMIFRLWVEL